MNKENLQETGEQTKGMLHVTPDVVGLQTMIVNLYFIGKPNAGSGEWALVDTGIVGSSGRILRAAEERFGAGSRPAAIILTHGHFDHVGAVKELANRWDVPVFAHPLEMPYLTGRSAYPPPDPTVGGGAMALMSFLYPRGPINISDRVRPFAADGQIPGMPDWRVIHTPGHTAGHVALFRERDRVLIAGDAFVTVRQESALAVLTQRPEVWRPPAYYTTDWSAARTSVETIAGLRPEVVATGHGIPMRGHEMQQQLAALAKDFDRVAVPATGRYVEHPAITDERGVVAVPQAVGSSMPKIMMGAGAVALAGLTIATLMRRNDKTNRRSRASRVKRSFPVAPKI